jgi:Mrp family chromosome partitioning ATPase
MLQALKNLEARSVRPGPSRAAAKGAVAVADVPRNEPAMTITVDPPAAGLHNALGEATTEEPTAKVRPTRRPDAPPLAPPSPAVIQPVAAPPPAAQHEFASSLLDKPVAETISLAARSPLAAEPLAIAPPATAPLLPAAPSSSQSKKGLPCRFERLVRQTLSDPIRSEPLVQMAARMRQDAERTVSKTLAAIGVGASGGAYQPLVYTATLLAATAPRGVLLIDADLARRPLSEALEHGDKPGLAELLKGEELLGRHCLPTAVEQLSILPAGRLRHLDVSAVGPRLEQLLSQLADRFSLVLVDAGRTGDLSASVLARLADATYFVVQLGTVETSEAQAALREYRAAGARVLGCIAT